MRFAGTTFRMLLLAAIEHAAIDAGEFARSLENGEVVPGNCRDDNISWSYWYRPFEHCLAGTWDCYMTEVELLTGRERGMHRAPADYRIIYLVVAPIG